MAVIAEAIRSPYIREEFGVAPPPSITPEFGLQLLLFLVPLLVLLICGRRAIGYWIGGLFLLLEVVRRAVTLAFYIIDGFPGEPPEVPLYAALVILIWLGTEALLLWLFIRFTFGRPSRLYFGILRE
jgi:hypothetical protein